ncbi:VOC family protein [Anaerosacchariphilus polymeriproducens]|uniref:VOC family protein n=1 Tax=Anaerosacchariphilus polymeriproducens TaxID=1812858 RepID=UPI001F3F307A|nr:VOC family protein [Anaerosacchariphilus polymeriproducens]
MKNIHHIGYLVKNIEDSIQVFEALGYVKETEIINDEARGIYICFLIKDGYRVELVSPINENSTVSGLIKKLGNTPYHICYEVEKIEEAIDSLKKQKYVLLQKPKEAVAIEGKRVAFLYEKNIGMIELVEVM